MVKTISCYVQSIISVVAKLSDNITPNIDYGNKGDMDGIFFHFLVLKQDEYYAICKIKWEHCHSQYLFIFIVNGIYNIFFNKLV